MDKQKIENKAIYFMCLLSMICILVLIAYFFFLRNVEIDIMANAQYTYVGENGNASVTVSAKQGDLNLFNMKSVRIQIYQMEIRFM